MRGTRVVAFAFLSVLFACNQAQRTPTAPTTTPIAQVPTVQSLTIVLASSGDAYQASAVAGFSDGSTRDVTGDVAFTSSNPAVAVVTPQGYVTPIAPGTTEIRCTYQSVTGSVPLAVLEPPASQPSIVTLEGTLRDAETGRGIYNAGVEIVSGAGAGRLVRTDGEGRYGLDDLTPGELRLRATARNYETQETGVTLTGHQRLDFDMVPSKPTLVWVRGSVWDSLNAEKLGFGSVEMVQDGRSATDPLNVDQGDPIGEFAFQIIAGEPLTLATATPAGTFVDQERELTVTSDTTIDFLLVPNRVSVSFQITDAFTEARPVRCFPVRLEFLDGPNAGRVELLDAGTTLRVTGLQPTDSPYRVSAPAYESQQGTLKMRPDADGTDLGNKYGFRMTCPTCTSYYAPIVCK